jgi:hypothetical protein
MRSTFAFLLATGWLFNAPVMAAEREAWTIVIGHALEGDLAVNVAVDDLIRTGADHSLVLTRANDSSMPEGNVVLVGDASRNARNKPKWAGGPEPVRHRQGYRIRTVDQGERRILSVSGGSTIGEVYGMYWIWDRLRVHKCLPDINVDRAPAMKIRMAASWWRYGNGGNTKLQMRQALRQSTNWIAGPAVLDLVPWNCEPEASANAAMRDKARPLIDYAHRLHMKYYSFANEFTYHPSLIKDHGATLSPEDPRMWDALQAKFRMLFTALPELDGIELCNDDISGFWDRYCAYDLLHEPTTCEWSYEKRFRTFVQKTHEVVAEEFGKTYFHFTWGLRADEQHCQPAVFRNIFTDQIPTDHLYLMPKITTGDRWWHQPYNSTFNQTAHRTIVCFETMNYYESGRAHLFPTFSGQYFQAGLQTLLLPEKNNLSGAAGLAGTDENRWDTRGAYAYVLYRLMWDPDEEIEAIARDFCAIHFGRDAANDMAAIYLMSPAAYKYGLHIEPVSYGQFNSFIHMRVGTFPAEGYPAIDHGREHLEFLRKIYLRCKPWRAETFDDLEHGLTVAGAMRARFAEAKPRIANATLAGDIENRLRMTELLIKTNIGYVRTAFALLSYLDAPTAQRRKILAESYDGLVATRKDFTQAPGFSYQLFGVDVVLRNAKAALDDVEAAKHTLAAAPSRAQLDQAVAARQKRYRQVLKEQAEEAVHLATVEISIDGRDILNIAGDTYTIDHLRWDGPQVEVFKFHAPLQQAEVTVIPKDLYSRPMHPFVLQQPTAANNYTARLYLDDLPGGKDWMKFELYYVNKKPAALGLAGWDGAEEKDGE